MGRVTEETAYQDIRALLERGDFATAEKLMKRFPLTEDQRRALEDLRRSAGRRRSLARRLEVLRRRGGPRFLRNSDLWGWMLPAGAIAYMAFALVWMRWLPPVTLRGGALARTLRAAWHFLPLYLYFFLPAVLYDTKDYLQELYRWNGAKAERAEVVEIRQETRTRRHFRGGQTYSYQVYYAVVRLLEPRRGEPETLRFALYEDADRRFLIQGGEREIAPWDLHPGEPVTLYRDRTGWLSLVRRTKRSLTRHWLRKLGSRGGWLGLFYLLFVLHVLAR